MIRTPPIKLSPKQQIFVAEYLKCSNASQAAIAAGYRPESSRVRGHQLYHHPLVKAEIDKARQAIQAKGIYNLEIAMQECLDTINFARETGNANAMAKAIELRSKLNGLLVEKHEVRSSSLQIGVYLGDEPKPPIEAEEKPLIDVKSSSPEEDPEDDIFS